MKTAVLVAWSGNGKLSDLVRTSVSKIGVSRGAVVASRKGLMISGVEPVDAARRLYHLPGVAWIAAGYAFEGAHGYARVLGDLAPTYLGPGSRFRIQADVEESSEEQGDVVLEGTGIVLKSVKKTRVDETKPQTTFRISMVKNRGAVGVQLAAGPGGVPTSAAARMYCLVSGGYHSAALSWMAALSGYSVTLVHARVAHEDESLRQVARLYAELSRRIDPTSLRLAVLEGRGGAGERLASWLTSLQRASTASSSAAVAVGVHPECRGPTAGRFFASHRSVHEPLLLLQEDEVRSKVDSLGLKLKPGDSRPELTATSYSSKGARIQVREFGGRQADISGVLDSILRR